VETALKQLRLNARVHERFAQEEALRHPRPQPVMGLLSEILARPPEPPFRIDGLLPSHGRMTIVAQNKVGKTTLDGNMFRSLLTGDPFLGAFDVQKLDGRIVTLNCEIGAATYARWMGDMGIDAQRLYVINMRGTRNLLATEDGREELAEIIRAQEGEVVCVDPFSRAFTGRSQDDATEVTAWLVQLDEICESSGASELLLNVHAGWDAERTRGSTALEDWPDVKLYMTKNATGSRFIRAEGRDVDVSESQLAYDPATRLLSLSGGGTRLDVRDEDILKRALPVINAAGAKGISPTAVLKELGIDKNFSMAQLLNRHSRLGAEIESTPNPHGGNFWRSLDYIGLRWEEAE
jgi:AAA domain